MEALLALFREATGALPQQLTPLPSGGSPRRYVRLSGGGQCLMGVQGTDARENRTFWTLARHFRAQGLPVPEVLRHSPDFLYYLQEDLGSTSLFDALAPGRAAGNYSPAEKALLHRTLAQLPRFQYLGAEGLDFDLCYPHRALDRRTIRFDLHYFKYCFLKPSGTVFDEQALEDDFEALARSLEEAPARTFLYRDFQARNVMLRQGEPWFIDFQGGMRGPIEYDVASFLWQAKAQYGHDLREALIDTYLEALRPFEHPDPSAFRERLRHFVLFRTLQVLGAYGFRGHFEQKAHFLESIPYALANLRELLARPFAACPYLCRVLEEMMARTAAQAEPALPPYTGLTVRVESFSYKKGLPKDPSGNGGGYVFDCRGLHNPGQEARFKHRTGRDADVAAYLEERGEVFPFLEAAKTLAAAHISRYLQRGFTHLSFSFGCTGGQHRSVYCAEQLARHLARTYPVRVVLVHREQHIREVIV